MKEKRNEYIYTEETRERGQVENAVVWRTCGFEEASIRGPRKFVPRMSEEAEPTWSRPRCMRGDSGEGYERGEGG